MIRRLWDCEPIDVDIERAKLPLEPVGARIVVKEFEVSRTASGLYIPKNQFDQTTLDTNSGVVLACGSDAEWVSVGDIVYFGRHSGFRCELNKSDRTNHLAYRIMNDEDVIARFKPEVCNGDD